MSEQDIPYSQACENNKQPILEVLKTAFTDVNRVLEIGSGTGQHAVYFAKHLPHLTWQTADQEQYHSAIQYWLTQVPSPNLLSPLSLSIPVNDIPSGTYDGFFSANTAHIMQKHEVQHMMHSIMRELPQHGVFCQYGPFTIDGKFSSQSNEDFHEKLIASGRGGYCDITQLQDWAQQLALSEIIEMPANNLMLLWHRA
jgi:cyclopropane fatty-acyl-phospholipid synthase-like methyltransferase